MTGQRFLWAPDVGVRDRLILVQGTSAHGTPGDRKPASDLYAEGTIPLLRARIGASAPHRDRVRFLSNLHGLVPADQLVSTVKAPISEKIAHRLRPAFKRSLWEEFERDGVPREVLIMADTAHTILVADIDTVHGLRPVVFDYTIASSHWTAVTAVLDRWGWP